MSEKKALNTRIQGKVQGVFYRASTKEAADRLGVTGWVKNMPNGDVQAVFEADPKTLERMIAWCWQGPEFSAVTQVTSRECDPEQFTDFQIRY